MTRTERIAGSAIARLITGFLLVTIVFAAAWLWSLYGPLTSAVTDQQERNLTAMAQSASLLASESSRTPEQIAEQLVDGTDLRMTIVAEDGRVIADSDLDPTQMENHADREEIADALNGSTGSDLRTSQTEGNAQLYVAVPGSLDGERIAVRVSQPVAKIEAIADGVRRAALLLLVGALAIAAAVAWWITRAITQPVQVLSASARRMADGDLTTSVPPVPSDLQPLASSLGRLRDEVRGRIDALEAERASLRATLDGLTDTVLVLEGERVVLANRQADTLLRIPAGGWSGASLDEALPGSLQAAVRARLGEPDVSSADLAPDPTGRTLRLVVAPLDLREPGRRIVILSDITKGALLDQVRRDFVANASHELKTPVAGIKLLADSAATAAADGDDEMALTFARQIAEEVSRLQRLVGDLLDLSRLDSAPSPDAIADVRQAAENAVLSHRLVAARKGLELSVDTEAVRDTDVFVRMDPTDFTVAIDNLLDNAVNYTESGEVVLRIEAAHDTVTVSVADTGPGIPAEHQPRIFERFYRVDTGRSRESGGTGLGLALVRHVVDRAGGTISLRSSPGAGSTFTLVLPRAH